MTDRTNCGGCGNECSPSQVCTAGACACAAGLTVCGTDCANLQSNRNHCGACGNACAAGRVCIAGTCAPGYSRERIANASTFVDACSAPGAMTYVPNADDSSARVMAPFPMRYWGTEILTGAMINITSNGWLGMDGAASASLGGTIPSTSTPNSVVAVFWADLATDDPGVCVATVGTAPNRRWVVEWRETTLLGGTDTFTAEAVFNEGSNVIELIYRNFAITSSATVGIEGPGGTAGVSGCPDETVFRCAPTANSTVRFTPSP
jgi:hypothetical protein